MRPIDADALIEQMEEDMEQMEEPLAKMFTGAAISDIKHAPTVEAPDINVGSMDIVRCPDCYYNDGTAYCELHFRNVKAKDFCSWAERRKDATD